ncbi:MAG TPA: Ig-like domain-containing protein, partial [Usitatibacter sp.]|nr:Ig-like domain-containing protein [Usitatibacter sp.]
KIAAPIANNDGASTTVRKPVTVDILANDSCVGSCDPASVSITQAPSHGSVVNNGNGTVTYTSSGSWTGTDGFKYTVRDTATGTQTSNTAQVSVQVTGALKALAAGAPTVTAVSKSTVQNSVVGVSTTGSDPTCFGCSVSVPVQPAHGTVKVNYPNAGEITYTPNPDFLGTETFGYAVKQGTGISSLAAVTVGVNANPVTDVVTIDKASVLNGALSLSGTVSSLNSAYAAAVQVFAGAANASRTGCTGVMLGAAQVGAKGAWSFSGIGATAGSTVCVQSTNLGVNTSGL